MSLIDKSFHLLRTNTALTGNVKIVVTKNNKIYLESFNANKLLKLDRFKHYEVRKNEYYKEVVSAFFNGVENKTIFQVLDLNDKSTTYSDYRFQFDDTYITGAQFVEDNFYNEEYEYTAPLYIKNNKLPKEFIILRVDGSGSLNVPSDKENFRERIINKWKFVDSFDLTESSIFGTWLKRNFIDDIGFPQYPLDIKHGDIELTNISGLDVEYSGWVTKSLNLHDTQNKNTPIFRTEEFFTKLWEDNHLIYPHILNLKFLFDDTPATQTSLRKYSINRYLGFYVDEKVEIQSISPFKGFELNVVDINDIEGLDYIEVSTIPYIKNNTFVREIDGRYYSFDPIKNGWDNNQTYWIEWKQKYYRLERVTNTVTDVFALDVIIGDYLYKIISDITIERSLDDIAIDTDNCTLPIDKSIQKRVIINDLGNDYINDYINGTTYKDRITITPEIVFNDITVNNIIENSNTNLIRFKRTYDCVKVNGVDKYLFTLEIVEQDNTFTIENYDECDLHIINIEDKNYVIKRHGDNTPNVAGKYYLNSDYGVSVTEREITSWINNGNITLDSNYYNNRKIESIKKDGIIPFFKIYRINFTDIKDFDFDRVETDYSRYEYEKQYEIKANIEPKLYAKEYRESALKINTLINKQARRQPVLDINGRPLNLRDQRGELNPFTNTEYTEEELYYKNADGTWKLYEGVVEGTNWVDYDSQDISLSREYYREEGYLFKEEDEDDNLLGRIDFRINSDKNTLYEELTWGTNSKSEISDDKLELPEINSKDPNVSVDINYIPVSSEYINSDELWELRDNDLTPIWDKNQSICKWGILNSKGKMDLPYRLNYSLDLDGREPNMNTTRNFPERNELNLDYFYRFGLKNKEQYQYYSLHLNEDYFDIDKYFSNEFDYFEYLLKSDQLTNDGIQLTNKYSLFNSKDDFTESETLFRGVKYNLSKVEKIVIEDGLIDDIITKTTNYSDYKFSIVFGRKLSKFKNNAGNNSSNLGIDIYLNDIWKNVLIHININTDEVLQICDLEGNVVNAETCEIDYWYEDNIENRNTDTIKWDNYGFKINNFSIDLRPRDIMLWDFINVLQNYNFEPTTINKEKINFIHIYSDNTYNIMDYSNTDFILSVDQPTEIVIKENMYKVKGGSNIPDFKINNTLENRIIVDNDPNNPFGNPDYTSDGLEVGSINDINSYNNYPIYKTIDENKTDTRLSYELDNDIDPSIYRYDGVYVPIFKTIPLFRPYGYNQLKQNIDSIPKLKVGNWKFYDTNLIGFGLIEELLFSKCNEVSSILKIQNKDDKEKSVYPMVDEYGYDFDARYIFTSNWESNWHYKSKLIEIPENDKTSQAGFTVHFDGVKEYLRIPDAEKFNQENSIVEDNNYANYILNEPTGERSFFYDSINTNTYDYDNINTNTYDSVSIITKTYKFVSNTEYKIFIKKSELVGNATFKVEVNILNPTNSSKISVFKTTNNGVDFKFNINTNKYAYGETTNNNKVHYNVTTADSGYTQISLPIGTDLPTSYIDGDLVNYEFIYTLSGTNVALDFDIRFDIVNAKNMLNINTNKWYLDNNKNNEIGDILFGGFIRKNNEIGNIVSYPAFSRISNAIVYTEDELTELNPLWKEFAGINNARPGRVGVAPYDYASYPIPKNWNGDIYIDILNKLRSGSGDVLETEIKVNNHYGYDTYSGNFDVSTLFHFLEYGSQDEIVTTNLAFSYSKFGASRIVNEFYKLTGFDFGNRGFTTEFSQDAGNFRILNDTPFEFEPDYNVRLEDGKSCYYIGKTEGNLTIPSVTINWGKVYRDKKIIFDIIPKNGNKITVEAPLIHLTKLHILSNNEVINEINKDLENSYYKCTGITTGKNCTITIESLSEGSYYNFDIELKSTKDFIINTTSNSSEQKTISEKFTKTSIRDDRRRGVITDVTVEFWIRVDAWRRNFETILYKGEDSTFDIWSDDYYNMTYAIGKFEDSNKLAFKTVHKRLNGSYVSHILTSNLEINDGEWHHLAFTCDLKNRRKSIYIDGELDSFNDDYLTVSIPNEQEMVAQFLDNRQRFLYGINHPKIGVDSVLATKIRLGNYDTNTEYWFNVIRGTSEPTFYDLEWQYKNWSTTITNAYLVFSQYYESLDYYLRVDSDVLNWDILIGTDSIELNGNRNFEGLIDELRIWNYARSEEQINMNYRFILNPKAYLNPIQSLVAYYRFDEGLGVNKINDLMNGNMVKDIDKWSKVRTTYIYDGRKEKEIDEISFFQFVNSFYTGSSIDIDDEETDWDVSNADIVGVSDERNISSLPSPIIKESTKEVNPPNTKNMLKKLRRKRLLFNIEEKIFRHTKSRTINFRPIKWWLFKDRDSRIKETNLSSSVRNIIQREGKTWLSTFKKLIKKRR